MHLGHRLNKSSKIIWFSRLRITSRKGNKNDKCNDAAINKNNRITVILLRFFSDFNTFERQNDQDITLV